ncbi:MAG: T9SS type A sorting domain-containing protein [Pedobacter sp.]|nr:MAG: T9SS type A sorting domain-containing protein [Pedobacter sp.]
MKLDLYPKKGFCLFLLLHLLFVVSATAQDCTTLTATYSTTESRCIATGTISVAASGGSGNYNYKASGPVTTSFTSSAIISGLPAGSYQVTVRDVTNGCLFETSNIVVGGSYSDPRFNLAQTDVTCTNGNDGTITVINQANGRNPFVFTIVAPSASNIGLSNSSGIFTNLVSGDYSIQLIDSCGGIQTRRVSILNYNWFFDGTSVTTVNCDEADVVINLRDNKGNTNLSGSFFNGFQYGVVRGAGDTVWSSARSFRVYKGTLRSLSLVVKDACGVYKYTGWTEPIRPMVGASVAVSGQNCTGFTAAITSPSNLSDPLYCLYRTGPSVLISCNTTGTFTGVSYGSYRITVRDDCYDTTIVRTFSVSQPVPSISATVSLSAYACNTFTATVGSQVNLSSPNFCLYNNGGTLVSCNGTGIFTGLSYGSYSIVTTDGCTGTTFTRNFAAVPPVPVVGVISATGLGCNTFNITMGTGSNQNSPLYCLYDNLGNQVACNSTGNFPGVAYGNYCVRYTSTCYDTIIERCIGASAPVPAAVTNPAISNQLCTTFSAGFSGTNLTNPQFCLYDNNNVLMYCQTSGLFNNLSYGSYTVRVVNNAACYDTTIVRNFTVNQPRPVGGNVTISNRTCAGFQVNTSAGMYLTAPQFCVYDNLDNQVACNSTGTFTLPYGNYQMRIINTCYDTTIIRPFTVSLIPTDLSVSSTASCNIGFTTLQVNFSAGVSPYNVRVYNQWGTLMSTVASATSAVTINGLAALPAGQHYKVVGTDNCGGRDSMNIIPTSSWLNKSILTNSKCPSGVWQNGSGDIIVSASSSFGAVVPVIIRKNGGVTSLNYSSGTPGNYTFSNMEPATYVIEYTVPTCSNKIYDTFQLQPYSFPTLQQSAAYQCDNNSFSVGAAVTGGVGPFTYEVIGSMPSSPSIISAPQASPVFGVNNGTVYSLIRLRSIDACGNATLNDVSIRPLANVIVTATSNCMYNNVTLNVDSIPNANYEWYKFNGLGDSVLVGTSISYNMPELLPSDTGRYVSKVLVNSGCLTKLTYFRVDGGCGGLILAAKVSLSGKSVTGGNQLTWVANNEDDTKEYQVERSSTKDGDFKQIAKVTAKKQGQNMYIFTDNQPVDGNSFYRVRIITKNNRSILTNTVSFKSASVSNVSVFPNPVRDVMNISIRNKESQHLKLSVFNASGQTIYEATHQNVLNTTLQYRRPASVKPGVYVLKVNNLKTGEISSYKVMFE